MGSTPMAKEGLTFFEQEVGSTCHVLTLNILFNLECETMRKTEEKNRVVDVVVHVFFVSVVNTYNKHT